MIQAMDDSVRALSKKKKALLVAVEIALVMIVLIFLLLTYMPAIIGGNPESR